MCLVVHLAAAAQSTQSHNPRLLFPVTTRRATAAVAALVCRYRPFVVGFIVEVVLRLFLGDERATYGASELDPCPIGVPDDVNDVAAEGVLVDEVFDL